MRIMPSAEMDEVSGMSWDELDRGTYRDETEAVTALLASAPLSADARRTVRTEAVELVAATRNAASRQGWWKASCRSFRCRHRKAWR